MFYISGKDKTDENKGFPPAFGTSYGVVGTFVKAISGHAPGEKSPGVPQNYGGGFNRGIICNEIIAWWSGGYGNFQGENNLTTGYVNLYTMAGDLITGLSGSGSFGVDYSWAEDPFEVDDNNSLFDGYGVSRNMDQKDGILVIGAPRDSGINAGGAAWIYDTGGNYVNKITAPAGATGFASSVAVINSGLVVCGAPATGPVLTGLNPPGISYQQGAAYIYTTGGDLMSTLTGNQGVVRVGPPTPGDIRPSPRFGLGVYANSNFVAVVSVHNNPDFEFWPGLGPVLCAFSPMYQFTTGGSLIGTSCGNGMVAANSDSMYTDPSWGKDYYEEMVIKQLFSGGSTGTLLRSWSDGGNIPLPVSESADHEEGLAYGLGFGASEKNFLLSDPYHQVPYTGIPGRDSFALGAVHVFDLGGELQTTILGNIALSGKNPITSVTNNFGYTSDTQGEFVVGTDTFISGFQIFKLNSASVMSSYRR